VAIMGSSGSGNFSTCSLTFWHVNVLDEGQYHWMSAIKNLNETKAAPNTRTSFWSFVFQSFILD